MPWRSVAVDDGQPEQAPFMSRYTTPSLKPRNVMSPPSLATAGRTRASISSLIAATVSESFVSKNSWPSLDAAVSTPLTIGAPDMKCSMMAPRIAGLSCCHSPSPLVTAMKSEPKNTPDTPVMPKRRSASGDWEADSLSRISSVPLASTDRPGRNLSVAGFGVGSVWMNMACSFQSQDQGIVHCNRWRLPVEVQAVPGPERQMANADAPSFDLTDNERRRRQTARSAHQDSASSSSSLRW